MGKSKTYRRKNSRKVRKSRKMKGGGCGCSGITPMTGGFGPASFSSSSLSPQYYYSQNDYSNDPNNPSAMISTRNMTGGKKSRKNRQFKKKFRGGSYDAISAFGTTTGAMNLLTLPGNSGVSSAPYDQPTGQIKTTLV